MEQFTVNDLKALIQQKTDQAISPVGLILLDEDTLRGSTDKEDDQLRTQLLQMLGHALKNSIHIAGGYVDLLMMNSDSGLPTVPKYLDIVAQTLYRMASLIDETISVECLISDGERRPVEQFNPSSILMEAIFRLQSQVSGKHQRLVEDIHPQLAEIMGIRLQLQEAMANLISNSIKYTPKKGQITVHASHDAQRFFFYVKDTGYGIPKALQPELFTRGYRANRPEIEDIRGTGYGLNLVKNVIESHHGRVWFESVDGVGSTFGFFLPLAITDPIPQQ